MEHGNCLKVLENLLELGRSGAIPWVLLRPREISAATMFQGDFDLLIDESRFDEILNTVFRVCQEQGVSFVLLQLSAFKRQIELIGGAGGNVTLELWPHAEFRISEGRGHLTRAAIGYREIADAAPALRDSLLGAVFILHLHHKNKDLGLDLVRSRIGYFLGLAGMAPEVREALCGLENGHVGLAGAQARMLAFLQAHGIRFHAPRQILARRLLWNARGLFKWRAPRTTAVVGPDGSGKTALIEDIRKGPQGRLFRFQKFKRIFRRPLYHLIRKEPRNVRDEKMLWLVLPVAWLCFAVARLFTFWGKPLILDRYFYDYFVVNARSKTQPMRRVALYALCSAFAPRPSRLIIASCPVGVIHQRKQEMTEAAIGQIYGLYMDQAIRARVAQTLFCHTGGDIKTSQAQIAGFLGIAADR
jgi:hypothetical protein